MSRTVEAYNYRIGLDVSSLQSGGVLTRRELSQMRRDFSRLREPGEHASAMMGRLSNAFEKGGLDAKQYAEAVSRINAKLPENVAATKQQATAAKETEAIQKRLLTESQQYGEELKRMAELVKTTNLSRAEATTHLKEFKASLPSAIAAQREQTEAEREAQQVRKSLASDTDRYGAEQKRLERLVSRGELTQEDANRALESYRQKLPSVTNAERERVDLQRRGATLTDRYATETEKLTRQLAKERHELELLNRAGMVDPKTYSRARADLKRRRRPPRRGNAMASLGNVSSLAGPLSSATGLVAMGPPIAALAVTIGSVVVAYKAAELAAGLFARGIEKVAAGAMEQAEQVVKLDRSARMLGTSTKDFTAIQFAAQQNAGMTADQTLTVLTKLSAKISEAATGSGDALGSIQALGLDAEVLATMDPSLALREIVKAASELPNPIDRARIAAKLFGEEGLAMADVLAGGTEGMEAAALRASELGLSLDAVDAIGITNATNAMGLLSLTWDGWTTQIAVETAPVMEAILTTITDMITPAGEVGDSLSKGVGRAVPVIALVADSIQNMVDGAMVLKAAWAMDEEAYLKAKADFHGMSFARESAGDQIEREYANAKQAAELEAAKRKETKEAVEAKTKERAANEKTVASEEKAEKERVATLKTKTDAMADEFKLAKQIELVKAQQPELDDTTAQQQAELQLLGATADELNEHLRIRRELVAIEGRNKADEKEVERIKTLTEDAKKLKESYKLPVEKLATEYGKLDEMRRRDLITAEDHARAKREAAEAAIADEVPEATQGIDANDGASLYAALVEQEQAGRANEIQRDQAERMQTAAEALAATEAERLATAKAITEQMKAQAEAAEGNANDEPNATANLAEGLAIETAIAKPNRENEESAVTLAVGNKPELPEVGAINRETSIETLSEPSKPSPETMIVSEPNLASFESVRRMEGERLASNEAITKQMQAQAELAERISSVENRTTQTTTVQTTPGAGSAESEAMLSRIADASEAAAESLSNWQIIGV